MKYSSFFLLLLLSKSVLFCQDDFAQLGTLLPTPNDYRTASGAPGPNYYQQKADYNMKIRVDDKTQKLYGEETITYTNNSKDILTYLWLQLDQNLHAKTSTSHAIGESKLSDEPMSNSTLENLTPQFEGGYNIEYVKTVKDSPLKYTINQTMMRVELPQPLLPKQSYSFKIKWWYNIIDRMLYGGRSGYEYFSEDDNYLYTIAHFFPRMCVYDDVNGWQNKQFLGRGEFTLSFGDYYVEITVPEDHLVAATGELQNMTSLLTPQQLANYNKATNSYEQPVIVANQSEAEQREKTKSNKEKTWKFKATNVRDFAFANSRKFIWDAMAVKFGSRNVMAMSMYPKEGNPLWEKYSTKAVAHTLKTYSEYTFDYPYPVAWSINADRIGMEYPMICFNFGRCEKDGTYSERTKYGMIGVIIHEVGHNYFPMIVNSDERQWTWMDEGLNTFLQFLTEQKWERDYPSNRGPAHKIVDYMKGDKATMSPIMTNSESINQFGNNAYGKPATALNILRETVMGRELFDYAFKEYSNRWKFKNPTPADFFRTMEDASGVDLDWFWRGWFFGTNHVDLSIKSVKYNKLKVDYSKKEDKGISSIRNEADPQKTYAEIDTSLLDFYNYNRYKTKSTKQKERSAEEQKLIDENKNYYEITFENIGGLPMPIIIQFQYEDGTEETVKIPAEAWRFDNKTFTKTFPLQKAVKQMILDPYLETADVDRGNNFFPPKMPEPSKFEVFKARQQSNENEMQKAKKEARP